MQARERERERVRVRVRDRDRDRERHILSMLVMCRSIETYRAD